MVKWIIVHTNSDNGCMEFKLFYGTEIEVRQLLKSMAVKSDIITNFTEKMDKDEVDIYEEISDMIDDQGFDPKNNTYTVMVSDQYGECDEVFTAIELDNIKTV
jgi:hypothetical protein